MTIGHLDIKNRTGILGETIAANLLRQKGYRILERNWRTDKLEVDIIAQDKENIIFVEVKTRRSEFTGKAEEQVKREKERHITQAANIYIKRNQISREPRFDIIGILLDKETDNILEINHIESAFHPPMRTIGNTYFSGNMKWRPSLKTRH